MDLSFSTHEPSPSPEDELASLFESHCHATGAAPAGIGEFEELKAELLSFIESLILEDEVEDGGGLALSEPEVSVTPIGVATEEDGGVLVCVELLNTEGQSVLVCADEEVPIVLPPGSRAAMLYDFRPLEDGAEDGPIEARFSICLGNILTDASHRAECARILNHDLDGFYGRKLCELSERYHQTLVNADSISAAEFGLPLSDAQVIRFLDSSGSICFAELGPLGPTKMNYVRSIQRFPAEGVSFNDAARGTLQSEALVTEFTSFYSENPSDGLIVEGDPVADDYIPRLTEHLRECFFLKWDEENWRVIASTAVFPNGSGGFCIFARVVDPENRSILPTCGGTTTEDPLYAGFAVNVIEDRTQGEPQLEFNTFGFVLTQDFLHRDLETMSREPEKALLSYILYDVINEDLVRRKVRSAEQEDSFKIREIRVSFVSRSNARDTYSIHVTHEHGEHVLMLFRNLPSGLIRVALQEIDATEGDTDFGLRYVVPPPQPLTGVSGPQWELDPE